MWKKKYPALAGIMSPPSDGTAVPNAIPQMAPQLPPAQPSLSKNPMMDEEIKKRALQNIAKGHKGF